MEARKGAQPRFWWSLIPKLAILSRLDRTEEVGKVRDQLLSLRPGIKIADVVWMYRRYQRPDPLIVPYVETLRDASLPEGKYRALDIDDFG